MTLRIVCKTTRNTNNSINVLRQALSLEIEVFGQDSSTVKENATKLIKMCNKLAVKMLKIGRFDDCMGFISDASELDWSNIFAKYDKFASCNFKQRVKLP